MSITKALLKLIEDKLERAYQKDRVSLFNTETILVAIQLRFVLKVINDGRIVPLLLLTESDKKRVAGSPKLYKAYIDENEELKKRVAQHTIFKDHILVYGYKVNK